MTKAYGKAILKSVPTTSIKPLITGYTIRLLAYKNIYHEKNLVKFLFSQKTSNNPSAISLPIPTPG
jgi:hypothetical protein